MSGYGATGVRTIAYYNNRLKFVMLVCNGVFKNLSFVKKFYQ